MQMKNQISFTHDFPTSLEPHNIENYKNIKELLEDCKVYIAPRIQPKTYDDIAVAKLQKWAAKTSYNQRIEVIIFK